MPTPEEVEVEQAWTMDKYDVPQGDLEFWAMRRGIEPAGRNGACAAENRWGATLARRLAIVAVLAYAAGLAMQACTAPLG